ncbi:MAG: hypothetical protein K2X74_10980 [Acetobacteraceae bacterium]|nr:hypothetical protein [Acetobacteraceae bacterium]
MTKYLMKPLTENSWILSVDGNKIGIISQTEAGVRILGNIPKKKFSNLDEFKKHVGGNLTIEEPAEPAAEAETGEIDGYPIKHALWHNPMTDPVSSYTRTKTSDIRYAAGYYAIKFVNGWTQSFCPKLATLVEHEYIGPYKNKLEMRNAISQKNQEKIV